MLGIQIMYMILAKLQYTLVPRHLGNYYELYQTSSQEIRVLLQEEPIVFLNNIII